MSFLDRFEERGFLTLTGLFDANYVDALRGEYQSQFEQFSAERGKDFGMKVGQRRFMLPIRLRGPFLESKIYAHPLVLGIVREFLGPDFLIDNIICICALPGAELQHLHADHPDLFPETPTARETLRPYGVVLSIPLVELTPTTGTTKLYVGSHKSAAEDHTDMPYLAKGDCFLFDFRIRHQGTENRSDEQRPVVYICYTRRWFTDLENFKAHGRINIDAADLAAIPVEHRPLFRRLAAKGAFDRTESTLFAD